MMPCAGPAGKPGGPRERDGPGLKDTCCGRAVAGVVLDWFDDPPPLEGVRMRSGVGVARLLLGSLGLGKLSASTRARGLDLNADWVGEGGPLATVFILNLLLFGGTGRAEIDIVVVVVGICIAGTGGGGAQECSPRSVSGTGCRHVEHLTVGSNCDNRVLADAIIVERNNEFVPLKTVTYIIIHPDYHHTLIVVL